MHVYTILVVDDEEDMRNLVEMYLLNSGYRCLQAANGKGEQKWFDVRLNPGDLISVPESTRHYFTLAEDRKTVSIRIFVTAAGWVPIYEKDEVQA